MPQPVAVSVTLDAPVVTALLSVKVVGGVIVAMVGFGGLVVAPVMPMPTASPLVLKQVTDVLAEVVVQPVSVTPAAVSDKPVLVAVAALLMTKVVPFVTELIVAPDGMLVPLINMPGIRPVVLVQVTVVVPFVAQFDSTIAAVRLPVAPRSLASPVARTFVEVHAFMLPAKAVVVDALPKISRKTGPVLCAPAL